MYDILTDFLIHCSCSLHVVYLNVLHNLQNIYRDVLYLAATVTMSNIGIADKCQTLVLNCGFRRQAM